MSITCYELFNYFSNIFQSQGGLGITEAEFAEWIMQEPPLLVWITTFNRVKSAEHSNRIKIL